MLLVGFAYYGDPPIALDTILATIANGGQGIVDTNSNREAGRNRLISCLIYYLILYPLKAASTKPFRTGSWG
jgi:hypothetical protein